MGWGLRVRQKSTREGKNAPGGGERARAFGEQVLACVMNKQLFAKVLRAGKGQQLPFSSPSLPPCLPCGRPSPAARLNLPSICCISLRCCISAFLEINCVLVRLSLTLLLRQLQIPTPPPPPRPPTPRPQPTHTHAHTTTTSSSPPHRRPCAGRRLFVYFKRGQPQGSVHIRGAPLPVARAFASRLLCAWK